MTNRSMTLYEKMLVSFTAVLALSFGTAPSVHAMHIMEGYLPGGSCIAWGVICLPFLLAGFSLFAEHLRPTGKRWFFLPCPEHSFSLFLL